MLQVKTNKLNANKKVKYLFKFGQQFFFIYYDCEKGERTVVRIQMAGQCFGKV